MSRIISYIMEIEEDLEMGMSRKEMEDKYGMSGAQMFDEYNSTAHDFPYDKGDQ